MFALAVFAETDLISALPRRFVSMYGERFGVTGLEAPLPLTTFRLNAVVPKVALMDQALAWLLDLLEEAQKRRPSETEPARRRNPLASSRNGGTASRTR